MDKRMELARLETRAAAIITRGKYVKCPGVLRKINRKIAALRRGLGIEQVNISSICGLDKGRIFRYNIYRKNKRR